MIDVLKSEKMREKIRLDVDEKIFLMNSKRKQASPFENVTRVNRKEIAARVKQLLNETKLSQKNKDTYTFYIWLEDGQIKTCKETAERFKIPVGTVRSRLFTARQELKKTIKKNSKPKTP